MAQYAASCVVIRDLDCHEGNERGKQLEQVPGLLRRVGGCGRIASVDGRQQQGNSLPVAMLVIECRREYQCKKICCWHDGIEPQCCSYCLQLRGMKNEVAKSMPLGSHRTGRLSSWSLLNGYMGNQKLSLATPGTPPIVVKT